MKSIIFSKESINAILENRKTETRRVVKSHGCIDCLLKGVPNNNADLENVGRGIFGKDPYLATPYCEHKDLAGERIRCRYKLRDILYVKEPFYINQGKTIVKYKYSNPTENNLSLEHIGYYKLVNARFMPLEASRIKIRVLGVSIEPLFALTVDAVRREGILIDTDISENEARNLYFTKWDQINPKFPSSLNPFVFVITFEVVEMKQKHDSQRCYERFSGIFKDDPIFDEIVEAGKRYRESQK